VAGFCKYDDECAGSGATALVPDGIHHKCDGSKNGRHHVQLTNTNKAIHKSLRDFRTLQYNNQDRHSRKEHINR
jgi:hypothetical protein